MKEKVCDILSDNNMISTAGSPMWNVQILNQLIINKKALINRALSGDPPGARTQDPNIKSVVLYLLS